MPGWRCFMIEPSPFIRISLRRFTFSTSLPTCPGPDLRGHDAEAVIEPKLDSPGTHDGRYLPDSPDWPISPSDPRWPRACARCLGTFLPEDQWQVIVDRLYQGAPGGKLYGLGDKGLPPGAMWWAQWLAEDQGWAGKDGRSLVVQLPSGIGFPIDAPASGGGHWDRSGTPPLVTVTPSINDVGRYHGNLRDGLLTEDAAQPFPGLERTA